MWFFSCRNINSTLTNILVKVSTWQLFQSKLNGGAHRVKPDPIGDESQPTRHRQQPSAGTSLHRSSKVSSDYLAQII